MSLSAEQKLIFKRFSNPHLETNDVEWFSSQVFRGLLELPIKLG